MAARFSPRADRRVAFAWPFDPLAVIASPRKSPDCRLPKSARLSDAKVFVQLLQGRRKASGSLELAMRPRADELVDRAPGARLGVVVGRKNLPRAVDRNTVKRIVREAFRQERMAMPPRDMLFRLRQRLTQVPRVQWKVDVAEAVRALIDHARRR